MSSVRTQPDEGLAAARPLILFLLAPITVGALAGWATQSSVHDWYPTLDKPAFTPPDRLFSPVWSALYLMMGYAAYRVWRNSFGWRPALAVWGGQLLLNLAWSFLFFYWRRPDWALAEIILLDAAVAACAYLFWRRDRLAGYLMLPYLAWILFATALNYEIWRLNY